MVLNHYEARSENLNLIDRVNSELCRDGSATGGMLKSYRAYGKLLALLTLSPQPSWSAYHLHTEEPLRYRGLSISLTSRPTKSLGIVGSVTENLRESPKF